MMGQEQVQEFMSEIEEEMNEEYVPDFDGELIKPNVDMLCSKINAKIKKNYSQVVVVSSMKQNGMGKSALLYWMGKYLTPDFSFERNFFFTGTIENLRGKTNALKRGEPLLVDEMVRLWYKRRAMSKGVIDLNEWMAADQRKTGVPFVGAIPDFWDLDSYARQGKVDWYIEVLSRGVAVIFKPDRFPSADPWHFAELQAIQKSRKKVSSENLVDKIELLQKHPCYWRMLFWNPMPKDEEKHYLKVLSQALIDAGEDPKSDELLAAETKFKRVQDIAKKDSASFLKLFELANKRFGRTYVLNQIGCQETDLRRINRWSQGSFDKEFKEDKDEAQTALNEKITT